MYSYDENEKLLFIKEVIDDSSDINELLNDHYSVPSPKRVRYEEIITKNECVDKNDDESDKFSYPWDKYKEEVKKIIINDKITQIPKRAFSNCHKLTTVELHKAIASIEDEAFTNCYHLIDKYSYELYYCT